MQTYTICPSESKDCSNQFNVFQLTQADHKMVLYLKLRVDESYSLAGLANLARFKWVDWRSQKQVFNLDIETMR